jgi:hypothetical protein
MKNNYVLHHCVVVSPTTVQLHEIWVAAMSCHAANDDEIVEKIPQPLAPSSMRPLGYLILATPMTGEARPPSVEAYRNGEGGGRHEGGKDNRLGFAPLVSWVELR